MVSVEEDDTNLTSYLASPILPDRDETAIKGNCRRGENADPSSCCSSLWR